MYHKFKIGDKVRILDGNNINDYAGGWTNGMCKCVSNVCTICNLTKISNKPAYYLSGLDYIWDERGLELVTDKDYNSVVLYHVNNNPLEDAIEIKVVKNRLDNSDYFSNSVNEYLSNGYTLIKTDVISPETSDKYTMLYALLIKRGE